MGSERGLALGAAVAAVALGGLSLAGCGGDDATPESAASHPSGPHLVKVATLEEPISLAQAPGAGGSLYVAERGGRVRLVRASGEVERRPVLDLSREITTEGEGGLLSVAFDPDFERNRLMYVYYAGNDKRIVIASYRLDAEGGAAVPSSRRDVLAVPHPNFVHWGGQLAFGPDGQLYAGTGDAGPPYPIPDTAQDPDSMLGKLLRIDPAGGRAEIVAMGLRNPWRYSFDRDTGDVWIGDVGDFTQEEIDHVAFGELEGSNFGWPGLEGTAQTKSDIKAPADAIPPVVTYERSGKEDDPVCAVTGGYVVRDRSLPTLDGRYLYGDFCEGRILAIEANANDPTGEPTGLKVPRLVSFGEDLAGQIYAISLDGPVYRVAEG